VAGYGQGGRRGGPEARRGSVEHRGEVAGSTTAQGLAGDIDTARVSHNHGQQTLGGVNAWRR
jgi:hypothetical protein